MYKSGFYVVSSATKGEHDSIAPASAFMAGPFPSPAAAQAALPLVLTMYAKKYPKAFALAQEGIKRHIEVIGLYSEHPPVGCWNTELWLTGIGCAP